METSSFHRYAKIYDLIYRDKPYSKEVDYLESLFSKFGDGKIRSIFDVAAGTGSHVIELSQRGYHCHASDLSPDMVRIAKERISKKQLDIPFSCSPMQEFQGHRSRFDVVICMFSAINYLNKRSEILKFFKTARECLQPGGFLVFDFWNGVEAMRNFEPVRIKEFSDENFTVIRISRSQINRLKNLITVEFEIFLLEEGIVQDRYTEKHSMRYFFPVEMQELLDEAGFSVVHVGPFMDLSRELQEQDWNISVVAKN